MDLKFGINQFTTNSPLWAKRLRVIIPTLLTSLVMYNDILAPLFGTDTATFDKVCSLAATVSVAVFSMFGVPDESEKP